MCILRNIVSQFNTYYVHFVVIIDSLEGNIYVNAYVDTHYCAFGAKLGLHDFINKHAKLS